MKICNIILIGVLLSFLLLSCDRVNKIKVKEKTDTFYKNSGGFDRPRIPLIKPYELLNVSESEWRLELQNAELLALSIHHVKGLDSISDRILVYSEGGTEFLNKRYDKAWFIIAPKENKENAFGKYSDFLSALKRDTISKFAFKEPNKLYDSFTKVGFVKW